MALYTRQQLGLILALAGAAGVGVAVDRWRHAYPELVERVEQFDRAAPEPSVTPAAARSDGEARPRAKRPVVPDPPVDLNTASADELVRLPGLGPALAARIVEARAAGGPFGSVDDLRRVRGLGHGKLDRLRPFVVVAETPPAR